nr:DNA recombination protein RmuC [uncultured Agathobaculum sp.]
MQYIPIITLALVAVLLVLVIVLLVRRPAQPPHADGAEMGGTITALGSLVSQNLKEGREAQRQQLAAMDKSLTDKMGGVTEQMSRFETRLHGFTAETTQNLENIRATVDKNLRAMQEDNNKKLEDMRKIVDEKLQKTLSERMNESFRLVNERLEQVYKGLGEMQTLAQGVGDLKKVLTNVKTRGIVGEIQLGAILEDILAPEQYEVNVATRPGSRNVVEYAVKLPVEDGGHVWLPIDSKFPGDTYGALRDAYEDGVREQIDACAKQLIATLKAEAKDIRDKYIEPPYTTDFGILFLPFEGLYAEVVSRGLVEVLQRDYHVNIAGPSTMAALLNSLQMSFRTIAIQKRSGEVWSVLGAVKTEFDKFEACLTQTQTRLDQASRELDKLVGTRTRAIRRRLKGVTELTEAESQAVLGFDADDGLEPED